MKLLNNAATSCFCNHPDMHQEAAVICAQCDDRQQRLHFTIYLIVTLCLCAAMWQARGTWDKAQADEHEAARIEVMLGNGNSVPLSVR